MKFTYINSFFLLYDIIIGICAAQASSAYAPLALHRLQRTTIK